MSFARTCLSALVAAATMTVAACGNFADSPVAPGLSGVTVNGAGLSGGATVTICHRSKGGNDFVAMSVSGSALAAHENHGDVRVGHAVPGQDGMVMGQDCIPVPLVPRIITFAGLSGVANFSPFAAYSELGLTVAPTSGDWLAMTSYGAPAPAIIFNRLASDPTLTSEVRVTADGSVFGFTSVDLYSSITTIPYTITGLLDSSPVFALSGIVPNTFGTFATVSNPSPALLVDTLVIAVTNPATPCCANPAGLDNIAVRSK